jgi:hypothetical protein
MAATDTTGAGTMRSGRPCARIGCSAPAVASFGFEASTCLVWLDPASESAPGAGLLCGVHADRLTPPRGWNLLDRRVPEPRLWADRPPPSSPPRVQGVARPDRVPRSRPRGAPPALPFATVEARVEPATGVGKPPAPAPARPWADLDRVLDARSPLLARAFEGAREAEAADRRADWKD